MWAPSGLSQTFTIVPPACGASGSARGGLKEESEKAELKLSTQIAKITASGPITSWQTDGGKVETVTGFIFLGYKITTDND